jgi:glycosyltransferase involved in cell wall biosynthesis
LVSDGSGVLVTPGDAEALANALDGLLGDRARLEQMGNAGLETLRERAGWPVVARRTVEAYEQYLGAPRTRVVSRGARAPV